jgi:hypothetical protein
MRVLLNVLMIVVLFEMTANVAAKHVHSPSHVSQSVELNRQ